MNKPEMILAHAKNYKLCCSVTNLLNCVLYFSGEFIMQTALKKHKRYKKFTYQFNVNCNCRLFESAAKIVLNYC